MRKRSSEQQQSAMRKTEAFVREALTKASKRKPAETTVRAVAKKVARALPQQMQA
jgi:hypothetical protein